MLGKSRLFSFSFFFKRGGERGACEYYNCKAWLVLSDSSVEKGLCSDDLLVRE